jgi:CRISPR/Cas system CMR subunit Cmr6 (Cas7 group RAMP superfamily)
VSAWGGKHRAGGPPRRDETRRTSAAQPGRDGPRALPYPEATAKLYDRLTKNGTIAHPSYTLARMVRWYPEWRRDPPKRAKGLVGVNAHAFGEGRSYLQRPETKRLALEVLRRRSAWLAFFEAEGLAWRLRLTARTDAVVWLASRGPLELGLALHHVYGFPVVPATSLKGLARRAAGTDATDRYGSPDGAAPVAMLEGLPMEGWQVQRDVMTPHFSEWYQGKRPPDDTEDPRPIPFLSLAPGSAFEAVLVARSAASVRLLDAVAGDLRRGLDERGLGAKTAAGYGVFALEVLPADESGAAQPRRGDAPSGRATAAPPGSTISAPAARSREAAAFLDAIHALRRHEVKPRAQSLAAQLERCREDERPELVRALHNRLRDLGLSAREIRDVQARHPSLALPQEG